MEKFCPDSIREGISSSKFNGTNEIFEITDVSERNSAVKFLGVYDKNAFDANPLELTNHYRLAFSAWELGNLGNEEKRIEAVELYLRLTELAPADSLAAERLEILRNVLNP